LLEPHKFEELYVCAPKNLSRRGKNGKKSWEEYCKLNSGKNVLTSTEWEQLQKIRKVFHINPKIMQFWKHGETEVSMFWDDVELGLDCKARMDWYDADSMKIVDLKFTNSIGKLSNHKLMDQHFSIQAAWYRRGVYQLTGSACDFLFIFIEKYSPHIIRVIKDNEEIIRHGEQAILTAIKGCNNKT
ncbi:MAG: PD-(D/E)XK nuclease-like domain-containing protein, partial [SAR324 cluster bacterium]|nr:PD-(D/E)XK nuclease-like domain-containing protein [SAR324 cluster bacterium]